MGNRDRLLTELLLCPSLAQYHSANYSKKVTDETVIIFQAGKYQVMCSPHHYNSSLVLSFGWEQLYLTPLLTDEPKTIIMATKGRICDEERLRQLITETLLDTVFRAVRINSNIGTYHSLKSGRGVLAWNFHNYQVYYKG